MGQTSKPSALTLLAPITGVYGALEDTPDEAMASGALGPGFHVEPLSPIMCAPISGVIISIARTNHAMTIRSKCGVEILVHLGVDTVRLNGEGFEVLVSNEQSVKAGDPLIRFDPQTIMSKAKSLATPIVLLTHETHELSDIEAFGLLNTGATLSQIHRKSGHSTSHYDTKLDDESHISEDITLTLADGIHARPAAQITKLAKTHSGEVWISIQGRRANAKSIASLMGLNAVHGDRLSISASGAGGDDIVQSMIALIAAGAGDPVKPVANSQQHTEEISSESNAVSPSNIFNGVAASSGLTIGLIYRHKPLSISVPEQDADPSRSAALYMDARKKVCASIEEEARSAPEAVAGILEAHLELIEDPELIASTQAGIQSGLSAGQSLKKAINLLCEVFISSGDVRLKERVSDLHDIERRLLSEMYGTQDIQRSIPNGAIVVAEDLMPSEFLAYVEQGMSGLCLEAGGKTSHVAILATGENIPTLVAIGASLNTVQEGIMGVLDTARASLTIDLEEDELKAAQDRIMLRNEAIALAKQAQRDPAITIDGQRITVYANIGSLDDASKAILSGAEGSGLLRTEFLFTDRITAPDEGEQLQSYHAILNSMNKTPLTIRTLDIGGDKPVPFLNLGEELNPALGMRGIRTLFSHPDLMKDQVRAILQASTHGSVLIMVPMVSSVDELVEIKAYIQTEAKELGIIKIPPIGTMVETPASAIIADQLADIADFLSIGTNDLTQYVLAMDRGHPDLAARIDGLHPAVLRLIHTIAQAGKAKDIPVSVCGGLASDPFAIPILLGLGIDKLSCAQSMIAPIKALIREIDLKDCKNVADKALDTQSPKAVRALVADTWPTLQRWT